MDGGFEKKLYCFFFKSKNVVPHFFLVSHLKMTFYTEIQGQEVNLPLECDFHECKDFAHFIHTVSSGPGTEPGI